MEFVKFIPTNTRATAAAANTANVPIQSAHVTPTTADTLCSKTRLLGYICGLLRTP